MSPQICHNNVALFQEERVDVHWVYLKCIRELSPRDSRAVHTPQRALTRPVLSVMGTVKSVTQAAAHVVQTMRFWFIFFAFKVDSLWAFCSCFLMVVFR